MNQTSIPIPNQNYKPDPKQLIAFATLPRLLYNHNPFYPISAVLMLYGMHRAVGSSAGVTGGRMLMEMLCGYTALLAVVGFLIARFGRVWDDARTILLIVALLLVTLSAAFDRIVLVDPNAGAAFFSARRIVCRAGDRGHFVWSEDATAGSISGAILFAARAVVRLSVRFRPVVEVRARFGDALGHAIVSGPDRGSVSDPATRRAEQRSAGAS